MVYGLFVAFFDLREGSWNIGGAEVGPRRPPPRSLRLGERGVPNLSRAAASLIMAASPQKRALTTETPGGVEEAHRRWPEG